MWTRQSRIEVINHSCVSVILTKLTYTRHDETSKMALEGKIDHLQKEEMISGSQDRLLSLLFLLSSPQPPVWDESFGR